MSEQIVTCPTCGSDDPELLIGECADRATRYGEGKRVRLRLVDPFHTAPPQPQDETSDPGRICPSCGGTGGPSELGGPCLTCKGTGQLEPAPTETSDAVQDERPGLRERVRVWVLGIKVLDRLVRTKAAADHERVLGELEAAQSQIATLKREVEEQQNFKHRADKRARTAEAQLTEAIREREEAERKLAAAIDNGVRLSNFYRGGGER